MEKLLQDATVGDPITGLKWTRTPALAGGARETSRSLARELRRKGFKVGYNTVSRLARHLEYTLRSNKKRVVTARWVI